VDLGCGRRRGTRPLRVCGTLSWDLCSIGLMAVIALAPVAFLTYASISNFWDAGTAPGLILSYDAPLILLVFVVLIISIGRVIVAVSRRYAE
jgi:hypothetical protein